MIIQKVLIGLLITLTAVFLGLQIFALEVEAAGIRALLAILLTTLYYLKVKKRNLLFMAFLMTFSVAEILNFMSWKIPVVANNTIDYLYFVVNSLYIIAYSFLITKMLTSMNLVEIIKKYPLHIIVLIVLDVFSVIVVTNTAIHKLNFLEYTVEMVYNAVIMILLTVALINYIYKDDKKAINLLMGAIFIFFSEVIQLAYFYISNMNMLNIFCSVFIVIAFLFFYLQSGLTHESQEESYQHDILV